MTALYEVIPAGSAEGPAPASGAGSGELCTVRPRYQDPQGVESVMPDEPVGDAGAAF